MQLHSCCPESFRLLEKISLTFGLKFIHRYQILLEKCRRLEEASNRKDNALRQSKMVLKFREEALKKLERANKEKTELSSDEKEQVIVSSNWNHTLWWFMIKDQAITCTNADLSSSVMHVWQWNTFQKLIIKILYSNYCQVSNIRHTLVGNNIVDHSDVVGASPVGAAPTTSSWST